MRRRELLMLGSDRNVLGLPVRGASIALQGFGNVGGAAARYLDRMGARLIAVADIEGAILDDDGLDVAHLLSIRDRFGRIDRKRLSPGTRCAPEPAWLEQQVDIMIPAAIGNAIRVDNQAGIRCRLLVEAANNPVTAGDRPTPPITQWPMANYRYASARYFQAAGIPLNADRSRTTNRRSTNVCLPAYRGGI